MDRLSGLFSHFTPSARTFYVGDTCRVASFEAESGYGTIHLLRRGRLLLKDGAGVQIRLQQPATLFFPRPLSHSFEVEGESAELLCASIDLGSPGCNPLCDALPAQTIIPMANLPALQSVLEVLFSESSQQGCGRQQALDSLIEYCLVILLRHLMDKGNFSTGLLAGLADPRLAKALSAIHDKPGWPWTLEELAENAGMSRARFAVNFRKVVGVTPMDYLTDWRMAVVQTWLRRGHSIKRIAAQVGYQSPAALTRTFSRRLGMSPRDWLRQRKDTHLSPPPTLENYVPSVPSTK